MTTARKMKIILTVNPDEEAIAEIREGLRDFNRPFLEVLEMIQKALRDIAEARMNQCFQPMAFIAS